MCFLLFGCDVTNVKIALSVLCIELFVNAFTFFAKKQKATLKSVTK
jgi:hypothetical protein